MFPEATEIKSGIRSGVYWYFFWYGTIIAGHGREIQIWNTTINNKGVFEAVINCPVVVLSCWNNLIPSLLWNTITEKELFICYPHTQHYLIRKSKYPLCVTQYFYSTRSYFHILFVVDVNCIIGIEIDSNSMRTNNRENSNIRTTSR